jgi:hypothetical protein
MGTGGRGTKSAPPSGDAPLHVTAAFLSRPRAVLRDQHAPSGTACMSTPLMPHTPPLAARRQGVAAAPGECGASPRDSPVASAGGGVAPLLACLPMALTLARVAAVPALVAGALSVEERSLQRVSHFYSL